MFSLAVSRNALQILVSFTVLFAVIHLTQSSRSFPGVTDVSSYEFPTTVSNRFPSAGVKPLLVDRCTRYPVTPTLSVEADHVTTI